MRRRDHQACQCRRLQPALENLIGPCLLAAPRQTAQGAEKCRMWNRVKCVQFREKFFVIQALG
jgi:hypothetical protein